MTQSKYEYYQQASLSQQLAAKIPIYQKLAGADYNISRTIGILEVLGEHGIIDLESQGFKLILDLMNIQRKAAFATSERVNEITKMGMQMPKGTNEVDWVDDTR